MLATEERERHRLAVGLHDTVCQKLVLIKLELESSLNLVQAPEVLASIRSACTNIAKLIEATDSFTFDLSNPILNEIGFVAAVERCLERELQRKHAIVCECKCDEHLEPLPEEVKTYLFRITRELLANIVKHASARKVTVSAHRAGNRVRLSVEDDGVGFENAQEGSAVSATGRFGLFSIREQLEHLGGDLRIESEPGRGTTATVLIPVPSI